MRKAIVLVLALAVASSAFATMSVAISLGVREAAVSSTDPNELTTLGAIGSFQVPSPTAGGIEWFNFDQQVLVLDGTWQQFTFNVSAAGISATSFTGNGIVNNNKGIFEHLRIKSLGDASAGAPISIWMDEIHNIYDPAGPPPAIDQLISTFALDPNNPGNPYANGTEVMFQEPGYSGSTSGNIMGTPAPNVSGIDNTIGHDDSSSVKTSFQFIDNAATRWVRLTTNYSAGKPESSPVIAEVKDGGNYAASTITIWLRGTPEPMSLLLLGLGTLILRRR